MITNEQVERVRGWFTGRLPEGWQTGGAPTVTVDREEITIVLALDDVRVAEDTSAAETAEARAGRAKAFREETRHQRMEIAREAQHRFERKVSWGVTLGEHRELFTHVAVPVIENVGEQTSKLYMPTDLSVTVTVVAAGDTFVPPVDPNMPVGGSGGGGAGGMAGAPSAAGAGGAAGTGGGGAPAVTMPEPTGGAGAGVGGASAGTPTAPGGAAPTAPGGAEASCSASASPAGASSALLALAGLVLLTARARRKR
jgi:MYXO-CTERM domain-containing protein